ncbi:MAG: ABC-F family ATP-binding cassette domain-containing protein [bacterium]
MSITLKKACKSYSTKPILTDVSISFNVGERIALVGENGAGKTTLLRLCAGVEELSSGYISRDEYTQTCYIFQEFPVKEYSGMTGLEYVTLFGKENLIRGVKRLLGEFDMDESILDMDVSLLSGGQQKILDICTNFARKPQYLLVDEPENHLDIFARQILINLIKNYRGCIVFVSHDQELINSITNRIVEVEDGSLKSYTGSYEFYLEQKSRIEQGKERTWQAHEKKVDQLDRLIKRMHEWCKKNPDLGAQLSARKTQLKKLQERAPEKPKTQKQISLKLGDVDQRHAKRMLVAKGLTVTLGDNNILWENDISLFFGEKVALVGRNGSGKSTFLRAAMGKIPITSGEIKTGVDIKVGYFSQDAGSTLDLDRTPFEVISEVFMAPDYQVRSLLARYLIGAESCMRKIKTLSGGEKTRLRFCLLFAANNDLLLLDEPTNHLDPLSWEILAEALKEYQGTVLLVSHDRMFIDQTTDKLWVVEDRKIAQYFGSLNKYLIERG